MHKEARIESERVFHNEVLFDSRRKHLNKYYLSASSAKSFYRKMVQLNGKGNVVLEYGCGPGSEAFLLADVSSKVFAIDISDYAIQMAKLQAELEKKPIEFSIMDAENLLFNEGSLDLICGSGILHHLDLSKAYSEISRVLKGTGTAIFFEPLGHNPIINWFRKLTPKLRTADEHPLLISDIDMARKYFHDIEIHYFNLFSTVGSFFPILTKYLLKLDELIFKKFPFMRKYAWICVIVLKNPH